MQTLKFDAQGLLPAVAQDRLTGEVRMLAYMNADAMARTLETGRATFFSRSRQTLWEKGKTSGHTLHVREVYVDCDGDAVLLLVDPVGSTCHTGQPSCFFRRLDGAGTKDEMVPASAFLARLEREIESRRQSTADKSYTKSLLEGGADKIGDKLREEAAELAAALGSETDERVLSEAADVVYHLLVGLASRGLSVRAVWEVLAKRAGTSGHAEKASREKAPS